MTRRALLRRNIGSLLLEDLILLWKGKNWVANLVLGGSLGLGFGLGSLL